MGQQKKETEVDIVSKKGIGRRVSRNIAQLDWCFAGGKALSIYIMLHIMRRDVDP